MATVRGFLQRTLPALLALMLMGLTVPLGTAPGAQVNSPRSHVAVAVHADAANAHADTSAVHVPAVEAPAEPSAVVTLVVAGVSDTPHAQHAAGAHGSRAPPSTLV